MKITCSKCGKRFNAEQHMYICPKCNHYHSQLRVGSSINMDDKPVKKYRWETDPIELDDDENFFKRRQKETEIASLEPPTYPKSDFQDDEEPDFIETVDGLQRNGAVNKAEESDFITSFGGYGKIIMLAGCVIIGLIMLIGNIINPGTWSDDSDLWDSEWESLYPEEITVDYGDPMEFETFTVNVGEVSEPEFKDLDVEKGHKLVQINFTTESDYVYEDEEIWTDVSLTHEQGDDSEWEQSVYYALYEDEVASKYAVQKQLLDEGMMTVAHCSGTQFWIFEIPEEITEVNLDIISYIEDSEESDTFMQDEYFSMPIEL